MNIFTSRYTARPSVTDSFFTLPIFSDVLHPNRANVSKDELREKLAELYKANKDQVSCFGFRTQYGGGKSTGFALIYDSHEALKKFEPHYRLVRYGVSTKVEKASRQQRMYSSACSLFFLPKVQPHLRRLIVVVCYRQATQKQSQDRKGYSKDERGFQGEEEIVGCGFVMLLILVGAEHHGAILYPSDWHGRLSGIFWPQGMQPAS